MGISHDASQVVGYSVRLRAAGGRVGAKSAALFRKAIYDIENGAKNKIREYDAIDTGNMLNSVSSNITGDGRYGQMTGEVGPTAEYAIYVHDGTSKMVGRPFLTDAFDMSIVPFESALQRLAEEGL